jgi:hypothetical protein
MKFSEINTIYSTKIASMIGAGYIINTTTMNGSQGEIAHIDLRKENEVVRVYLHRELIHNFKEGIFGEQIILTVGRCNDKDVIATTKYSSYATIWNEKLEVIEERVFWKMESRSDDWYIEGDEGKAAVKKNSNREYNKEYHDRREFPGMENVMLPAVRRHIGNSRYPASNIRKIYKAWSSNAGKYCYYAETSNKGTVRFC